MQRDLWRGSRAWAWAVLALMAPGLAGCGAGASDGGAALPVVRAAETDAAPEAEPAGDAADGPASAGHAPAGAESEPELTAADVFAGTNLLEGAGAELKKLEIPEPADNSYCYVCHANYQDEYLTRVHLPVGVGCELCHGMSDEHSADEDGLVPPEIMWPKEWINATCAECHPRDELARQDGHREFLTDPIPGETCTDCHGENHRLNVRTRVWDRKTGELLQCDGVRMMDADSPAGAAR